MVTITLSIGDCGYWESQIRNAIQKMPGEKDVEVEVREDDDEVVVKGCNARAEELVTQLYNMVGLRASVVRVTEDEDEDDDHDDVTEDDDDEDDDDDDDDDDDAGLPATAIPEPSWEDQPVADPTPLIRQYYFF